MGREQESKSRKGKCGSKRREGRGSGERKGEGRMTASCTKGETRGNGEQDISPHISYFYTKVLKHVIGLVMTLDW